MDICFISSSYPNEDGIGNTFVEQLVNAMTRLGHHCVVISPLNTFGNKLASEYKEYEIKEVGTNQIVEVYRPRIWCRNIPFVPISLNRYYAQRAIESTIHKYDLKFDVMYCHFFASGVLAWHYAYKSGIPLFIATGESKIKPLVQKPCVSFSLRKFRQTTNGVVCVSTKNLEECVSLGYADKEKCQVFPNSVDLGLFHPLDRAMCRQRLNLKSDDFLLIAVGEFSDRKGQNRILKAVDSLANSSIKVCFIGKGEPIADRDYIVYKGPVKHSDLPIFLCASDVFVLPTLREGCCNAIVEALACGLPVISSDKSFNYDILNENNSIMVDPENVIQIAAAIELLVKDCEKRAVLSEGALSSGMSLSIDQRASHILDFIRGRM